MTHLFNEIFYEFTDQFFSSITHKMREHNIRDVRHSIVSPSE